MVLNGVAKTYAMTGWRVGWMIGPGDVIKAATNLQSHATSNVCNVAQAAALAAVSGDLSAVAVMRAAFDRRRQVMTAMLNDVPGVVCPLPDGALRPRPLGQGTAQRPRWLWPCHVFPSGRVLLDEVMVAGLTRRRCSGPTATSGCPARSATPTSRGRQQARQAARLSPLEVPAALMVVADQCLVKATLVPADSPAPCAFHAHRTGCRAWYSPAEALAAGLAARAQRC